MSASRPRVLCIAGSARRHGNSDRLLDAFAAGVEEAGGIAVRVIAAESGISPCRGCNACSRDGRCIQRDGMDAVYAEIDAADAIVVATAVYFATVPAVLKLLYDRCQPYWARRYVLKEPPPAKKRPGAILVAGGGGDPFGAQCAITPTQSVFAVLGVRAERTLEVVGVDSPDDVCAHPDELARAKAMGAETVGMAG
ncbi:MAG: flavodoxin family protein [Coriobacteriia bacterium]